MKNRKKIVFGILSCALFVIGISACGTQKKPVSMEVPETIQNKEVSKIENNWTSFEYQTDAKKPMAQTVQLPADITATLYTLAPNKENQTLQAEADGLTSVCDNIILNSCAAVLGEDQQVSDLASAELLRWANDTVYTKISYSDPSMLDEGRCVVRLRLENDKTGMEQYVIYTDLFGSIARVDRIWYAYDIQDKKELPETLKNTVAFLASEQTRTKGGAIQHGES